LGYGDLQSPLALAPLPLVVVHVLFATLVAGCAMIAQSKYWASKRTPFLTGSFVFPSGVIMARPDKLLIMPIDELQDAVATGNSVRLVFQGKSFTFAAGDQARAAASVEAIKASREKYRQAKAAGDIRQQLLLDPLQDSGVPNPLAPTEPWAAPVFVPKWLAVVAVFLTGAVLGTAVFWIRNTWGAKALFAAAIAQDDLAAYRAYLERGGQRPEVEAILLPRAELRDAQSANDVTAIEAYIKRYPKTRIGAEVTAAHRNALLAALERATKLGTLSALEQLQNQHEGHPLIGHELAAAKQAIFTRALQNFKAQAGTSPEVVPFVQRLLRYSQAHGPDVQIRFRPRYTQNYEHIENIVRKSPYYTGARLLPGQYFQGKYTLAREARVGKALEERLQRAFPQDVLHFQLGKQVEDPQSDLPEVKLPTLFIDHSVSFSGGFVGLKRQGMYMGMTLAYLATFRTPGQKGDQFVYRIRLWRAPKQELIDEAKDAEELYETLAADGYDTFAREYLEYWFKKP
jgi:hypothetical protein